MVVMPCLGRIRSVWHCFKTYYALVVTLVNVCPCGDIGNCMLLWGHW